MMQRLLTTPLLAAGLLLSTLGCAKKEDPAPTPAPAPGSSTHTVDGRVTAGTGLAFPAGIVLQIGLTSFTDGTSATRESLILEYYKPNSAPAYTLTKMTRAVTKTNEFFVYTDNLSGTVTENSAGSYSGTFAGTAPKTASLAASTITAGLFTEIR